MCRLLHVECTRGGLLTHAHTPTHFHTVACAGEFPPKSKAGERSSAWWYSRPEFKSGGYLSAKNGDGSSKVSVADFLKMAGQEGAAQYGK